MGGEIRIGIGDQRIALFDQPGQILFWQTDDAPQHPHGQLTGNFLRGIKRALFQRLIKDTGAQLADRRLELGHDTLGKGAGDLDAGLHVIGRIRFLKGAAGKVFFVALILHPDTAGG